MNIGLSLINSSTADRFPNIMFITRKKKTPTLQKKNNNNKNSKMMISTADTHLLLRPCPTPPLFRAAFAASKHHYIFSRPKALQSSRKNKALQKLIY